MSKLPNTTATGGYISPAPKTPPLSPQFPQLSLVDFLQSVIVGVSQLQGSMVRPNWQPNPPKRPNIDDTWVAIGIEGIEADFNAYQGFAADNETPIVQRHENFGLVCNFYGPNSYDLYGIVRDSLQLTQNLAQLNLAKVPFKYDTTAQHVPELIDEEWFDRWRAVFYFMRQVNRTYPLLTFASVSGTIYANTPGNETVEKPFVTEE